LHGGPSSSWPPKQNTADNLHKKLGWHFDVRRARNMGCGTGRGWRWGRTVGSPTDLVAPEKSQRICGGYEVVVPQAKGKEFAPTRDLRGAGSTLERVGLTRRYGERVAEPG